jgi:hypothetical protein
MHPQNFPYLIEHVLAEGQEQGTMNWRQQHEQNYPIKHKHDGILRSTFILKYQIEQNKQPHNCAKLQGEGSVQHRSYNTGAVTNKNTVR